MSQSSLVQRLIAFLKKPETLDAERPASVHNAYDDYTPREHAEVAVRQETVEPAPEPVYQPAAEAPSPADQTGSAANYGSRLDALLVRALKQFNSPVGYIIRTDPDGRMRYCTGRDLQGRYISHTDADPDRRALFLALDSGESQLFVHTLDDNTPVAVLCGPLWENEEVIGLLYLDNPSRSRLHRGVFDVFCDQAARMLAEGS
jgi:hypothetical protein